MPFSEACRLELEHFYHNAGKRSLVPSAVRTLPLYWCMAHLCLISLSDKMEGVVMGCLWGDLDTAREAHRISWKAISTPISEGGTGLKKLQGPKYAFLAFMVSQAISGQSP